MTLHSIMPVRLPPVTEHATRVLLEGVVDYAGVFPPASVSMSAAVHNYAHYRAIGGGWMLGRFVCPAAHLDEFSEQADPFLPRDAGAIPWRLSVTGSGNAAQDASAIAEFNNRHRVCFDECGAIVDAYETRVGSVDDVATVHAALPAELTTYLEVPAGADPEPFLVAIKEAGRRAKIRTGGVTPDAFPTPDAVVRFLSLCVQLEVTAKATAGLHHALRGAYPLTYEAGAATGRMFGYLNVLLTAALLARGASHVDAIAMLEDSNWDNFEVNDLQIGWRGAEGDHVLDRVLLSQVRERVLVSFGSCSFTEPVEEARSLGLL